MFLSVVETSGSDHKMPPGCHETEFIQLWGSAAAHADKNISNQTQRNATHHFNNLFLHTE